MSNKERPPVEGCDGQCSHCEQAREGDTCHSSVEEDTAGVKNRIASKIVVLSGKGGVGKSTVSANLAIFLALSGRKVGLMDVDVHGPSIPKLLGLEGRRPGYVDGKIEPVSLGDNLKVISIGFLLEGKSDAVVWRGPMKAAVIKQFIEDVAWGDLDALVVDCPPGTGDEPLSVIQLLGDADGAVVVTTPQELALSDVRRSIGFCRQLNLPVLGVVENMSGLVCPHCGEIINVFGSGGGEALADEMEVPFLGRLPLDPAVVETGDSGKPFAYYRSETGVGKAFAGIAAPILEHIIRRINERQ